MLYRKRWPILAVIFVVTMIPVFAFDYQLVERGSLILSILGRVQAAIFAIVFSVVILGVRLSASRYSPRLASSFKADPAYRWTVGIFGLSIGINIFGLYILDYLIDDFLTVLILFSGILAAGAFWSLYEFVNETLERTTPEGILTHIEHRLSPSEILERAHASAKNPTERDPFLVLMNVVHSSIAEKDRVSALLGLEILGVKVANFIKNTSTEEFEVDSPVDESLENICVDQLPDIAVEASDQDLTQTAIEVTDTAKEIGEAAISAELDLILEYVVRGQSELIADVGFEATEERIRINASDTSSELLKSGVENGVWEGTARGTRFLGWLAAASIMSRGADERADGRYTSLLILVFPKVVKRIADSDVDLIDEDASSLLRGHRMDVEPQNLVIASCYGSMAELTSAAIRFEIRTQQRLLGWESVAYGWTESMRSVSETGLKSMLELWFGTILYLDYLSEQTPSEVMNGFDPQAVHRIDSEIGLETIERLQNGRLDPTSRIDLIPGRVNPVELPLTGTSAPIDHDPEPSFEEWLEIHKIGVGMSPFGSVSREGEEEDENA